MSLLRWQDRKQPGAPVSPGRRVLGGLARMVIVLLVLEAMSRVALWPDRVFRTLKGFDAHWQRLDWVRARTSGKRQFTYTFDDYHPIRGWAVRPNLRNMPVFGTKLLSSNSRGLRGNAEHVERAPGTKRIVVLGDSFTFGDEVSDHETYAHYLGTLQPGTEVLNLGVHGYGLDQMLIYLKEEGLGYRPDIVLLGFVWFDIHRDLFDFNNYAKPAFELRGNELELRNVPVPAPDTVLAREPFRSKFFDILMMAKERVRWAAGINDRRSEALAAAILDDLVATSKRAGAEPVIAYLPVLTDLLDDSEGVSEHERFLDGYCRARQVRCVFLRPRFTALRRKGVEFNTRGHWYPVGHETAARGINEYLVGSGLVGEEGARSASRSDAVDRPVR